MIDLIKSSKPSWSRWYFKVYLTTSTTGFRNCIAVQLLLYGWYTAYFILVWFFFQKIFLWNCRRKKSGKIFVTTHVMSSNMSKINWNWWHEIELFRVFQSLVPKYCLFCMCKKSRESSEWFQQTQAVHLVFWRVFWINYKRTLYDCKTQV